MGSSPSKEIQVSFNEMKAEWKINKFSTLPRKEDSFLDSQEFLINGEEWFLQVRPQLKKKKEWIGVYLVRKCKLPQHVHVIFSIGIKKVDGSVYKACSCDHEFKEDDNKCGDSVAELSKSLEKDDTVISDDTLTVFCNARLVNDDLIETASQTESTDRIYTLAQNLKDLFLSESEADMQFKVKNRSFKAHRSILGARSPVFRSMFKLDMKEKNKGIVNIDEYDPEVFQDFLIYIYTGNASHITIGSAPTIYMIADKYDVKELREDCVRIMSRDMSVNSFFDTIILAKVYNESDLLKTATTFFVNNLQAILQDPKWLSFMIGNPPLTNELLVKSARKK